MYPSVHSSIIYNRQDMEAIWVSINRWLDKEDVRYIYIFDIYIYYHICYYYGILFNHKREHFAICSSMMDLGKSFLFSFACYSRYLLMWTMKFQMFKLDLEKAEETEIKLPTSIGSLRKQESARKTTTFALLTMPKPFTVWIKTNCGKFWNPWEYQTTLPASWEICMQVKM